ncbi:beta-N-acetylhexosaminidase [Virgibacillus siamensis]|uniref:beta-N-acetylhexosaminidase n=1 Tax=Virgibacillus siamensis TaxID=480071 RepID=UPI000986106A|nr:beta-N-acetylhexosaminidase [Virgibacillus siamensis]
MIKKIGLAVVIPLFLIGVYYLTQQDAQEPSSPKPDSPQQKENADSGQPNASIDEIFSLAAKGEVPGHSFTAGKTKIDSVTKKWGSYNETVQTNNGQYVEFPDRNVHFGIQNGTVFDVRLFDSGLSAIHYKEIKELKGKPDKTHVYKDETHQQIILVYKVSADYRLKWIVPKPTDTESNPAVDHISVVTSNNYQLEKQVETLTLDEKIGQMIFAGISGTTAGEQTKKLIGKYKVGGIILYAANMETPEQTVALLNKIKQLNEQNTSPVLLGVDQEGGVVSRLPGELTDIPPNSKLGTVNDPGYSHKIGFLLGKMVKEYGFNLDFAPVMDVNSNPDNPVIGNRAFSNNPEVVSNLGIQTMKGIQSKNVIPVIKHFPGHGDTSVDSHLQLPTVNKSKAALRKLELIPFKDAIQHGADVIMVAHILLPKIDEDYPSSMSKPVITGMLREHLQYEGVIISDDMTMQAITDNYKIGGAAVKSVKAGTDIIMVAHDYGKVTTVINALKQAVQSGEIPEKRIDQSVKRIIRLKQKYHLPHDQTDPVNVDQLNHSIQKVLRE